MAITNFLFHYWQWILSFLILILYCWFSIFYEFCQKRKSGEEGSSGLAALLQEALAETTNLQLAKQSSNALTHQKVDDDDDDDDVDHDDACEDNDYDYDQ